MDRREFLAVAGGSAMALASEKQGFPPAEELPVNEMLPDPLVAFNGSRVTDRDTWFKKRKPELRLLFQHYMYGYYPEKVPSIQAKVLEEKANALGGKGTLSEVEIRFGPEGTPPIYLLLAVPKKKKEKAPIFVGMNFAGNHAAVDEPFVRIPTAWMYDRYPGVEKNKASAKGRGTQKDVWNIEQTLDEGFALATFYSGDIDPDIKDKREGIQPYLEKAGIAPTGKYAWGTIAAWSWGIMRAIDYLVTLPEVDAKKIAVVGHSRLGKTALLTAAFDDRVALAIPNQAGCGGTAPSRGKVGESVKAINTNFPHWFNGAFKDFNNQPARLPFDQNGLVALCAPRPVLFTNAVEDTWANPDGQFEVLQAADGVYKLLGAGGLEAKKQPPLGELSSGTLGYFVREGKHSMTEVDWKAYRAFAKKHLL